jgi:oxygen-independent coproporphyrinogen-3 oxidase
MAITPITAVTAGEGDTAPIDLQQLLLRYLRPGTLSLASMPPLSLYVHLPWCLKKCPYCDFNSHEHRSTSGNELPETRYLQALRCDLEAALPFIWGRRVH